MCAHFLDVSPKARFVQCLLRNKCQQMKGLAWKVAFAALNPSPIFEPVAMFAEKLPMKDEESNSKEINGANDLALPKRNRQRSVLASEDAPVGSPET